jgi:putative flippase GtrA
MSQKNIWLNLYHFFAKIYAISPEKIRFLAIGSLNTSVGLGAFPLLMAFKPAPLHYLYILIASQILGISISFFTNKLFVFRSKGSLKTEYVKFLTFHGIHLVLNLIALPTLVNSTGLHPVWAQNVFAGGVIVTSYFWHRDITFKKKGCSNYAIKYFSKSSLSDLWNKNKNE